MTLFIYYYDWAGSFKEYLGASTLRLGGIEGLTEFADNGDTGSSGIRFDDPSANLGHSGDAIKGHKFLGLDELACAVGNRRMYTARIGDREYNHSTDEKGSLILGSARVIDADLHELNNILSLRLIPTSATAWKRSAETAGVRLAAILASTYLSDLVVDDGLVVYPSIDMDAADYREQRPLNVLEDIALATGYTFFLVLDDERDTKASLYFDDFLRATTYASTLRLSGVLSDRDSGVDLGVGATGTFASGRAVLTRSPERVYSRVDYGYRKGIVTRNRPSTATAFIERDGTASNAHVKTVARANRVADRFLSENRTEYDLINTSVELPPSAVNSIRRGHLISGKWPHLPGYESFTALRVLNRTIRTPSLTDDRYTLDLALTPTIVAAVCDPNTATDRALGVAATGYTDGPTTGGTDGHTYLTAPTSPTNVTDGNDSTISSMPSTLIGPGYVGQTFHRGWIIPLGSSYRIGYVDIRKTTSDTWPDKIEYYDGVGYTDVGAATITGLTDGLTGIQRWTLATPVTTTNLRVTFSVYAGGGMPFGFSFDSSHEVNGIGALECPA